MNMTDVSLTAFLPLLSRVIAIQKQDPVFNDPMVRLCLERLLPLLTEEQLERVSRWRKLYAGVQRNDAKTRVQQSMSYDRLASLYIASHPGCTVINLACGFDTRYWRIDHEKCRYLELDLPAMVALKREILKDRLDYELIGCSILDTAWIDQVTAGGNRNFLLIAEAVFMYLPEADATGLLQEIARRFSHSQLLVDIIPQKYTRGLWKWMIGLESKVWGVDAPILFGLNHPKELESIGPGFQLTGAEKGSFGSIYTLAINAA